MADALPTPFDVRLMNVVATLVFVLFGALLLAAGAWWVLRQPFFPLAAIKVCGYNACSRSSHGFCARCTAL